MGRNPARYTVRQMHNSAATAGPSGRTDMVETLEKVGVGALAPAPKSPLPYRRQLKVVRTFHTWPADFWPQCVSVTPQTVVPQAADSWM
jgi:hypothetical protein